MNIQQEIKQLEEATSKIVDYLSGIDFEKIEDRIGFNKKVIPIVVATKEQQMLSYVKTIGITIELLSLINELNKQII